MDDHQDYEITFSGNSALKLSTRSFDSSEDAAHWPFFSSTNPQSPKLGFGGGIFKFPLKDLLRFDERAHDLPPFTAWDELEKVLPPENSLKFYVRVPKGNAGRGSHLFLNISCNPTTAAREQQILKQAATNLFWYFYNSGANNRLAIYACATYNIITTEQNLAVGRAILEGLRDMPLFKDATPWVMTPYWRLWRTKFESAAREVLLDRDFESAFATANLPDDWLFLPARFRSLSPMDSDELEDFPVLELSSESGHSFLLGTSSESRDLEDLENSPTLELSSPSEDPKDLEDSHVPELSPQSKYSDFELVPPTKRARDSSDDDTPQPPARRKTIPGETDPQSWSDKRRPSSARKTVPNSSSSTETVSQLATEHRTPPPPVPLMTKEEEDIARKNRERGKNRPWSTREFIALHTVIYARREHEIANNLKWLRDTKFWSEMSMKLWDNYEVFRKPIACKNFWSRDGRARADYDERAHPTDHLITSAQPLKSKRPKKSKQVWKAVKEGEAEEIVDEYKEQIVEEYKGEYGGESDDDAEDDVQHWLEGLEG